MTAFVFETLCAKALLAPLVSAPLAIIKVTEQIFDRSPYGRSRYIRFALIDQALPYQRCSVALLTLEIDILSPQYLPSDF